MLPHRVQQESARFCMSKKFSRNPGPMCVCVRACVVHTVGVGVVALAVICLICL